MFFKGFVTMVTAVGQMGQGPCCAHHPHMVDQSQPFNLSIYIYIWTAVIQGNITQVVFFFKVEMYLQDINEICPNPETEHRCWSDW